MKETDHRKIRTMLKEIKTISAELPARQYHKVANRCDKVQLMIKKSK